MALFTRTNVKFPSIGRFLKVEPLKIMLNGSSIHRNNAS